MITEEDLITALREAQEASEDGGGLTMNEIAEATGWGVKRVRAALVDQHKAGRLVPGRRLMESIDGHRRWTPTYAIKGKA